MSTNLAQYMLIGGYAGNNYYTGADPAAHVVADTLANYGTTPTPDFSYYQSAQDRIVAASADSTQLSSMDKIRKALGLPTVAQSQAASKAITGSGGSTFASTVTGLTTGTTATLVVIGVGAILILGAVLTIAKSNPEATGAVIKAAAV